MSCSTDHHHHHHHHQMAFFHSNFMLQPHHHHHHPENEDDDDHHHHHHHNLPPMLPPSTSNPQEQFNGVASLLGGKRSAMPFSTGIVEENPGNNAVVSNQGGEEELSDEEGSQLGEKKRRLNMEQVRTLEKNFELGNKLEPERKMQLARALGLQPRQIAIWFQNRRARWKTKQLEKDYDLLKRQFEAVKAENDALQAHNHKLHAEIMALKTREPTESINLNKETEGSCSNRSENTSEIKLDMSTNPAIDSPAMNDPTSSRRPLFPISSTRAPPHPAPPHLFHTPSTCPNNNNHHKVDAQNVKEESLCNMFCGMDDQTGFWPWLEQQQFN